MTAFPSPSDSANLARALAGLTRLRWVLLAIAILTLVALSQTGWQLPLPELGATLVLLASANLLLAHAPLTPLAALRAGLVADTLALSALVALTGGAANPIASLFLGPVLFAALLSPGWFAWGLSLAATAAYGALFYWHAPWPLLGGDAAYAFHLHLTGMWFTFALSALLIAIVVARLAHDLSEREAALARAREIQLRNEQLVALGVQAAGAAHALSTPLNTLTLLADELAAGHCHDAALSEDLALMQAQLASCRDALAALKRGGEPASEAAPLFPTLAERLAAWATLRPQVRLEQQLPCAPGPVVALDATFWPALYNLLDNAAEAGGGRVELATTLADTTLTLTIVNPSGRLSAEQLARAGLAELPTDKPAGLGIGVLLTHATLSRLGGRVRLINRPEGGVCAELTLPLAKDA
ncbi:sensor histidine kinase [Crenobacter sp. SG2305]|uniref:ATP-binding protein n=1 Tax=Crenobacter oryzisoli TaxID=3056844 RepID=UPI0025AACF9F|nr:ATP-binding protein [Crenobacter sp. SG2305]MDN0082096.1 sensor histidine kinase [Crenobacter sp. SG2305]